MSLTITWNHVPPRHRFQLSVIHRAGPTTFSAFCTQNLTGVWKDWSHGLLVPGPATEAFTAATGEARLEIASLEPIGATVRVEARVVDGSGTPFLDVEGRDLVCETFRFVEGASHVRIVHELYA